MCMFTLAIAGERKTTHCVHGLLACVYMYKTQGTFANINLNTTKTDWCIYILYFNNSAID